MTDQDFGYDIHLAQHVETTVERAPSQWHSHLGLTAAKPFVALHLPLYMDFQPLKYSLLER